MTPSPAWEGDIRRAPGGAPVAESAGVGTLAVMSPRKLGSLIGAIFGLIFVLANTGAFPSGVGMTLRAIAGLAFAVVLVAALRRPGAPATEPLDSRTLGGAFGRGYWLVVAAEVVAIVGGLAVLNGPLDAPQAAVAWIATVVGAHFFALGVVWAQPFFHWLGGALLLCGLIGLVLAAAGASEAPIDAVAGVLPGALLLAVGIWGSTRPADAPAGQR
jgi:hypothetical protein